MINLIYRGTVLVVDKGIASVGVIICVMMRCKEVIIVIDVMMRVDLIGIDQVGLCQSIIETLCGWWHVGIVKKEKTTGV